MKGSCTHSPFLFLGAILEIVTDINELRKPCEDVSRTEGREIARILYRTIETLNKKSKKRFVRSNGKDERPPLITTLGLAAPQIGIHKKVAVLDIQGRQIALMNPVLFAHSVEQYPFTEGCLSLPDTKVETMRYRWVTYECLNLVHTFGPLDTWDSSAFLWSVAAQHEVDHLHGILAIDRKRMDCPDNIGLLDNYTV